MKCYFLIFSRLITVRYELKPKYLRKRKSQIKSTQKYTHNFEYKINTIANIFQVYNEVSIHVFTSRNTTYLVENIIILEEKKKLQINFIK